MTRRALAWAAGRIIARLSVDSAKWAPDGLLPEPTAREPRDVALNLVVANILVAAAFASRGITAIDHGWQPRQTIRGTIPIGQDGLQRWPKLATAAGPQSEVVCV